jgi:hypothetical protein
LETSKGSDQGYADMNNRARVWSLPDASLDLKKNYERQWAKQHSLLYFVDSFKMPREFDRVVSCYRGVDKVVPIRSYRSNDRDDFDVQ